MKIPFWHVDAFAGALFGGNPAGVCIVDEWPAVGVLQKIAAENNLPETAFVARRGEVCDLRWFTPAVEVDLCGHATLAAAYVLFSHRGWPGASIEFNTQSGPLVVTRRDDLLVMDFPFPSRAALRVAHGPPARAGTGAGGGARRPGLPGCLRDGGRRARSRARHGAPRAHRPDGRHCHGPGARSPGSGFRVPILRSWNRYSRGSCHGFRALHPHSVLGAQAWKDAIARTAGLRTRR